MYFKKFKHPVIFTLAFVFTACSSYKEFPVSEKTPGAEIKVAINKDKYENNVIRIKTKYLVNPERLTPDKSFYVVWIETEINGVFNVGRLNTKTNKVS